MNLRSITPRSEIILEEVPAPQKLASFSFAFSADVSNGLLGDAEDELASGRFVLLHEPGGQDTWEGEFRCIECCFINNFFIDFFGKWEIFFKIKNI